MGHSVRPKPVQGAIRRHERREGGVSIDRQNLLCMVMNLVHSARLPAPCRHPMVVNSQSVVSVQDGDGFFVRSSDVMPVAKIVAHQPGRNLSRAHLEHHRAELPKGEFAHVVARI